MAEISIRGGDCDDEGERGERGERGRRGHRGPTGPAGEALSVLKFFGIATVEEIATPEYLTDFDGVFFAPPNYPLPAPITVGSFAVNVLTSITVPPGESILFQLYKNNVPIETITYNPGDTNGIKAITFPPVSYAVGDVLDVAVTLSTGLLVSTINVSAMVGP